MNLIKLISKNGKNRFWNTLIAKNISKKIKEVECDKLRSHRGSDREFICPVCDYGIIRLRKHTYENRMIRQSQCSICGQSYLFNGPLPRIKIEQRAYV